MVECVEEVSAELDRAALANPADLQVLHSRHVPVELTGSDDNVAARVPETGGRTCPAQRERTRGESSGSASIGDRIQIEVVPSANAIFIAIAESGITPIGCAVVADTTTRSYEAENISSSKKPGANYSAEIVYTSSDVAVLLVPLSSWNTLNTQDACV